MNRCLLYPCHALYEMLFYFSSSKASSHRVVVNFKDDYHMELVFVASRNKHPMNFLINYLKSLNFI